MTEVAPAKLADTKIRVLNASGQGGQAAEVAGALRDLGFAQPDRGQRRRCTPTPAWSARARSGSARRAAQPPPRCGWCAPCTELFQDEAADATVDLALGTEFGELAPATTTPKPCWPAFAPTPPQPPDSSLLSKIHTGTC